MHQGAPCAKFLRRWCLFSAFIYPKNLFTLQRYALVVFVVIKKGKLYLFLPVLLTLINICVREHRKNTRFSGFDREGI